ncbi:uncharacterized protein NPIL_385651 [Nephila pilipes]|uniref:Uncharacterized protein n=1 Tax=Nephila pilipes TaxID=299642 RepID=A0A8X6PFA1_NEPPI|nr:uncharacterized protein NPIL_385651 [Nephila pilipes]
MKKEIQADFEIGYSFHECELLLLEQDNLEFQCADIYSQYSILKQESSDALKEKNFLGKQFKEYSKILDDVCRSLAAGLGNRRNLISSSALFHRYLFEFRKEVQNVKDFAASFDDSNRFETEMESSVKKIYDFIDQLCNISGAVLSQGLQLTEILTRLRLSEKLRETHRHHIGGWLTFVEVEREFRLRELNRLAIKLHLMWQLQRCNHDMKQAIQWLKDLTDTMLIRSNEIGESAEEADELFLQHIRFQEAGKKRRLAAIILASAASTRCSPAFIIDARPQDEDLKEVNLLSNSAVLQISRTMSHTDKSVQQVQSTYFSEEAPSATESASEYVSARSPETWRSTSISGVEDWCSIGSEGTTLDDFKSLDDDLAEEYCSDDNIEELPLNGHSATGDAVTVTARRGSGTKEYAAISGIQDNKGKKFTSHIQSVAGADPKIKVQGAASGASASGTSKAVPVQDKYLQNPTGNETAMAVSPKSSTCFEPPKYSSVITKTETEDVKKEVKKSYEIKTQIKAGGVSETFTSHKTETAQSTQPESKAEKVHKITVIDEPQKTSRKVAFKDDFPKDSALGSSSKIELLSEIEGLKSKYLKEPPEPVSGGSKTENKSESVSYGFSSFPRGHVTVDESGKTVTETSKVLYSKEVTESHSFTSVSFQQQSFGVTRSEKWQSVTPQMKENVPIKSIEAPGMEVITEKFKKLEEEIIKVCV